MMTTKLRLFSVSFGMAGKNREAGDRLFLHKKITWNSAKI
jgi:hypothetical protein